MLNRFKPSEIISPLLQVLFFIWVLIFLISKEATVALSKEYSLLIIPLIMLLLGIGIGSAWRGAYEKWIRFVDSFYVDGELVSTQPTIALLKRRQNIAIWAAVTLSKLIAIAFALIVIGSVFWYQLDYFINFNHEYISKWILVPVFVVSQLIIGYVAMLPYLFVIEARENSLYGYLNKRLRDATDFADAEAERQRRYDAYTKKCMKSTVIKVES